jgi:preprotein translocase subunit SecE
VVKKESPKVEQIKPKANNNETQKSNFVGNTQDELTKVIWPSRQQLFSGYGNLSR